MSTNNTNVARKANANARHAELMDETESQLLRIAQGLESHRSGWNKNWADVGDLAHLVEQLTDAANFINGTDED
ncbi:MAG: hypothetical protein GY838_12840 [bacterium]|nr:hypothetical protein [bacterium]